MIQPINTTLGKDIFSKERTLRNSLSNGINILYLLLTKVVNSEPLKQRTKMYNRCIIRTKLKEK
jgi:hypothetical protein